MSSATLGSILIFASCLIFVCQYYHTSVSYGSRSIGKRDTRTHRHKEYASLGFSQSLIAAATSRLLAGSSRARLTAVHVVLACFRSYCWLAFCFCFSTHPLFSRVRSPLAGKGAFSWCVHYKQGQQPKTGVPRPAFLKDGYTLNPSQKLSPRATQRPIDQPLVSGAC